jgi:type IV pilus assembly protein PilC
MPRFVWKGKLRTGQEQTGTLLADSRSLAVATLRRKQIAISAIREQGRRIPLIPKLPIRVGTKTLAIFTRQFSVMLDAGLPLVQCLEILSSQEENAQFAEIIRQIRTDVEAGSSLSDALKKHPAGFDDLYVNMVAAGEAGGILDIILQRLSIYIEKAHRLKSQVKSAMVYPVAVIGISGFVLFIILWKVIPIFAQLFAGLGAQMPYLTRIVIGSSNFIGRNIIFIFLFAAIATIGVNRSYRTRTGKMVFDRLMIRAPILGALLLKIAIARFCRTLSTLTSSGVPILEGLQITARTSGNAVVEEAILSVRKSVSEGKTISDPLAATKLFPGMVVSMIAVGEQTGALDQMLAKIADFYEEEVDTAVAGLMKLLEPVMIVFLGGVIGVIIIAMYLPMYSILQHIG